jgi:geranylgeranyl pyrophosphate synthase
VIGARPADASTLEQIMALGDGQLTASLTRVQQRLAEIAEGPAPVLGGPASATMAAGGKRLRPLLVLLCAGAPAGQPWSGAATAQTVRAAVAVELVHAATLVHDDVLDASALRRGRPTVVAEHGREIATATGDLLFSRAFAELVGNRSTAQLAALARASSALARGELIQREDAWRTDIGVDRYLLRCELKTARLFEAACELGVRCGSGAAQTVSALSGFGRDIGVAFQILDDVLDVSGPPERTGKPRGTDLLDGTVTLPLILARQRDPRLADLDLRSVTEATEAAGLCERIEAAGALESARERAREHVAAAHRALPAELDAVQRRALELVADGVVARYA